jgi:dihydroorotase
MYSIVFKEARLPFNDEGQVADVAVSDGVIVRIDPTIGQNARCEIRCRGNWLLPGAIDMHVHLRDPGLTHKEDIVSGTEAAVRSGVTTVADMPNTVPPTVTAADFLAKVERARKAAKCNVLFYMGLGDSNVDEIERVCSHPLLAGVKVFLGATTGDMVSSESALSKAIENLDQLFVFHAEDEGVLRQAKANFEETPTATDHHVIRPAKAAIEGAKLISSLAKEGRRLHIAHLSTAAEIAFLNPKLGITGEVSPHHLYFNVEDTARVGNLLKVNPPVRLESDRLALLEALADGRIGVIATDHAPHTHAEKALPYPQAPSGVPGLDTLVASILNLVKNKRLTMTRAVDAMSATPAKLLGLTKKGRVAVGADADLILWNQQQAWVPSSLDIYSRCDWSPFEGVTLASRPYGVWVKGIQMV